MIKRFKLLGCFQFHTEIASEITIFAKTHTLLETYTKLIATYVVGGMGYKNAVHRAWYPYKLDWFVF